VQGRTFLSVAPIANPCVLAGKISYATVPLRVRTA